MIQTARQYATILYCVWRNCLIREMTFRGHFLFNVCSELLWAGMLLIYIRQVIFLHVENIQGWTEYQYLFLMGTHMMITSLFDALFFTNCWNVSNLVRTGDLDFFLLRPVNTQFLLTVNRVDYSVFPNLLVGLAICWFAVYYGQFEITLSKVFLYLTLMVSGVLSLYALLFMFATTSIWLIRQTGVEHLWFYMVSIARYPSELYKSFWGGSLYIVFVYILPVLLVSNMPARVIAQTVEPTMVLYAIVMTIILLALSSVVFTTALRWYRSASS